MTWVSAISLLAAMLVLAAMPSASVALVVTRSAMLGFANGAAVAAGILLGDLVFVALAVGGASLLAETLSTVFAGLKVAGGVYLICLGLSLLGSKSQFTFVTTMRRPSPMLASFLSGLALTLGDVKAILFYASLFPAFVDMASLTAGDVTAIALITTASVGGIKLAYAYAAQSIIERLRNRSVQDLTRSAAGCCMVCTGIYLLSKA